MAKKILFGMVTIIILVIAYYSYVFFYATRQHSPEDTAIYQKADLDITLQYSRPYKKGRVIFAQSDEALQPYGKYWRLGANQATKLTVNRPVSILGNVLDAGSYALYAIPGESVWTIGFNIDSDRWGASPPDYEKDVFRIEIEAEKTKEISEQLTIYFEEAQENGVNMVVIWDDVKLVIPMIPVDG